MNLTYYRLELRRFFRDYPGVFFTAVLPAFFYVIFGAAQGYGSESVGNGNVTMYIMISMAAYGAVTATTGVGGGGAVERMQGWGRQLGLTPMRDSGFVAVKVALALTVAAIPIGLIYALGAFTGADGDAVAWVGSAAICILGAITFALFGMLIGLVFRSESAVGVAGGSLVILSFLGGIFIPLSGTMLTIAKFTPLYGFVALARRPLTEGYEADGSFTALWIPLVNVVVWALLLGAATVWAVRRGRGRQ